MNIAHNIAIAAADPDATQAAQKQQWGVIHTQDHPTKPGEVISVFHKRGLKSFPEAFKHAQMMNKLAKATNKPGDRHSFQPWSHPADAQGE